MNRGKKRHESDKRLAARLSGVLFAGGALVGGYGLLRTWLLYRDLPEGVCPFDPYRPLTYVALALLAGSIALDLADAVLRRRNGREYNDGSRTGDATVPAGGDNTDPSAGSR